MIETWTVKDIVDRLDEWSGGMPNGDYRDILVAAADKLEELKRLLEMQRMRALN